jgi:hypothetical protein
MATRFNYYSNWNKYSGYTYNYFDNIRIDLSAYLLKTNFDLLFNDISNNKQNYFTFIEPLIKKDISNNTSIDLSANALYTNFDLSFNDISNNKQDKLMFTTPLKKMYQII